MSRCHSLLGARHSVALMGSPSQPKTTPRGGRRPSTHSCLLVLLRGMLAGDLEEVLQDLVAVLRSNALGMELHGMDGQRPVTQAHDDVAGLGGDLGILGE